MIRPIEDILKDLLESKIDIDYAIGLIDQHFDDRLGLNCFAAYALSSLLPPMGHIGYKSEVIAQKAFDIAVAMQQESYDRSH